MKTICKNKILVLLSALVVLFCGIFGVKALIKDELPTFESPNNGNSGNGKSGHCDNFSALIIKFACNCFILRYFLVFFVLFISFVINYWKKFV